MKRIFCRPAALALALCVAPVGATDMVIVYSKNDTYRPIPGGATTIDLARQPDLWAGAPLVAYGSIPASPALWNAPVVFKLGVTALATSTSTVTSSHDFEIVTPVLMYQCYRSGTYLSNKSQRLRSIFAYGGPNPPFTLDKPSTGNDCYLADELRLYVYANDGLRGTLHYDRIEDVPSYMFEMGRPMRLITSVTTSLTCVSNCNAVPSPPAVLQRNIYINTADRRTHTLGITTGNTTATATGPAGGPLLFNVKINATSNGSRNFIDYHLGLNDDHQCVIKVNRNTLQTGQTLLRIIAKDVRPSAVRDSEINLPVTATCATPGKRVFTMILTKQNV